MKIFSAEQIREWDQYTILHEPVASVELMERAAGACTAWIMDHYAKAPSFSVFCGKGNNGGDGLAIARMLIANNFSVTVYILEFGHKGTDDFQINLAKLHQLAGVDIHFVQSEENFHPFPPGQVIIDALFGSGLNRGLEGITAALVEHINSSGCEIISIDIPSGMFVDISSVNNIMIDSDHTLSFQCYKPALLVAENAANTGDVHILDIGLHHEYYRITDAKFELISRQIVRSIYKPRKKFGHKGNYGHALLVAGSYGKIGAAVLAAKACMRSGAGLLTCHLPKCGYEVMQTAFPEVMVNTDFNSSFLTKIEEDITKYHSIGIGPGIGQASETKTMLREIFDSYKKPLVIDADALNIIGSQKELLQLIPPGSILTPHPKEFSRLFGDIANDFESIDLALKKSNELQCVIVLKGHYSFIAMPDGKGFFNSTGNPGMATAGSGDVLTGILSGLLAQGYNSVETAILGVYLHGSAGDMAAQESSQEALIASDIINALADAFKLITA
ncbi:MAG TPA: NAD(P)H-hydrate dehydratase [Chitinophagaceae bacterium]|nr:NAD(P)H-hydrate dehydratase [Chitinophagaceae bacterium]